MKGKCQANLLPEEPLLRFKSKYLTEEEIRHFYNKAAVQLEIELLEAHINQKLHPEEEKYRQQYLDVRRQLLIVETDMELTLISMDTSDDA